MYFLDVSNKNSACFTIEKLTAPERNVKAGCHSLFDYDNAIKVVENLAQWMRSMSLFSQLTKSDQTKLIENSWHELFLVTAVQLGFGFSLGKLY